MLWASEQQAANIVLRGARVLDPAEGIDATLDVRIDDGVIAAVAEQRRRERSTASSTRPVSCSRPPSSTRTCTCARRAAKTRRRSRAAPPRRRPAATARSSRCRTPIRSSTPPRRSARSSRPRSARRDVPVGFLAAITRGQAGEELTEMGELADAGAVAFSDDGVPVSSAGMMRRALQYASITGRPLALHCEEPTLSRGGHVHEGAVAAELGFTAYPSVAESVMVERDLALAAFEEQPIHLLHLSAAESVAALRRAREHGVRASGEVTPHHLVLTDDAVRTLDPNVKMNPPLRAERDRVALLDALARRDDRGDRHRPRAARAPREGRAVRGCALRRHRARDGIRGALQRARRAGPAAAADAARAPVERPGAHLRARAAADRRRRARERRPARPRRRDARDRERLPLPLGELVAPRRARSRAASR